MILDHQNMYCDDQAITATAVSTNIIDHTVNEFGVGTPVEVVVQVTADFDAGTVAATLQTASDEAFTTPIDLVSSAAIDYTVLSAGYQFALTTLPQHMLQFSRLNFTVTGTPTAGTVSGGLALDRMAP